MNDCQVCYRRAAMLIICSCWREVGICCLREHKCGRKVAVWGLRIEQVGRKPGEGER